MKTITSKVHLLVTVFMLLGCLSIHAADDDLTTNQITVTLLTAGTLPDQISDAEKYQITNLKVVGDINGTDLKLIRDMAGRDSIGNETSGKLSILDLSEAKIVRGGENYYENNTTKYNEIGNSAFQNCIGLTSIKLPYVTKIGSSAFSGCSGLTSINIPSSVSSLGSNSFFSCSGLKSIYVNRETPIRTRNVGSGAFEEIDKEACTLYVPKGTYDKYQQTSPWSDFQNIVEYDNNTITLSKAGTLPEKIGKIEKYYITNLKVIGDINGTDLRLIRDMAGLDYEGKNTLGKLTKLDLSEANIVSGGEPYYKYSYFDSKDSCYTENNKIGKYAFYGCKLTNIDMPSNVTDIGKFAFEDCKLTNIDMPSGVTNIDSCAFLNCNDLTSINIPSSVTNIAPLTFSGCRCLKSINIPSSVTVIGYGAFKNCESLTSFSFNIPSSITEIDSIVFECCSGLTSIDIPSSVTKIGSWAFYRCSGLTSIDIPSSVTEIGNYAFASCWSLTSIKIPSSVTKIGNGAISGCRSLTSIKIPSSVTKIGYGAFNNCKSLTSINIPSSITAILEETFMYCDSLTSINIPSSVTSIEYRAFYGCSKLPTLSLPSEVNYVGANVFYNCADLTSVYAYGKTPSEIDEPYQQEKYDKCNLAEHCTLYVPKGSVEAYSSSNWHLYFNNIKEFDVETGVQTIVSSPQSTEISRYDINGRKIAKSAKGINIIKYSDGSIRKEFVK